MKIKRPRPIATLTTLIATITAAIESELTPVRSKTTAVASDVTVTDAAITDVHSETTAIQPDTGNIYSDTAIIYSDTTAIESELILVHSETTIVASDGTKGARKMKKETKRAIGALITLIAITIGISLYATAAPLPPIYPPQQIEIPVNGIILWPGTLDTIPPGWVLCDGTNGTDDLRNVFVVGAGDQYSVGDTGGVTTTGHDHAINITQAGVTAGQFVYGTATRTEPQVLDNRPPYHAMHFIMRLE